MRYQKYGLSQDGYFKSVHKMSRNWSIRSSRGVIYTIHEPHRLMRRSCVLNAPREILVQESKIIEAGTQPVEEHSGNAASNVYEEDIGIEEERFALKHGKV